VSKRGRQSVDDDRESWKAIRWLRDRGEDPHRDHKARLPRQRALAGNIPADAADDAAEGLAWAYPHRPSSSGKTKPPRRVKLELTALQKVERFVDGYVLRLIEKNREDFDLETFNTSGLDEGARLRAGVKKPDSTERPIVRIHAHLRYVPWFGWATLERRPPTSTSETLHAAPPCWCGGHQQRRIERAAGDAVEVLACMNGHRQYAEPTRSEHAAPTDAERMSELIHRAARGLNEPIADFFERRNEFIENVLGPAKRGRPAFRRKLRATRGIMEIQPQTRAGQMELDELRAQDRRLALVVRALGELCKQRDAAREVEAETPHRHPLPGTRVPETETTWPPSAKELDEDALRPRHSEARVDRPKAERKLSAPTAIDGPEIFESARRKSPLWYRVPMGVCGCPICRL
jgi:hypothetical protein